jgi:hypothetical protein
LPARDISTLIVLGSGWLLDFPLDEVYQNTKNICLVDILHPPQILKKIEKYPGVQCIAADITGGYVQKVYDDLHRFKKQDIPYMFIDDHSFPDINFDSGTWLISLNILNQLDILIADYIKKHITISSETLNLIRSKLQGDHINLLKKTNFIIVTDHTEEIFNNRGIKEAEKYLLHTDLPDFDSMDEWDWPVDSEGVYNPGRKTILKVTARVKLR